MRYAYFPGCQIYSRLNNYDLAVRNVAKTLGVDLVDMEKANCCGPVHVRSLNFKTWLAMATRILAIAERMELDIVTTCNNCFSTLTEVSKLLKDSPQLMMEINGLIEYEGLKYQGRVDVKHFAQVLYRDYGIENIRKMIKKSFGGLKAAVQYGCHSLRPNKVLLFDHSERPRILDELVTVLGIKSIYWPKKLWCCGAPILVTNEELSLKLARVKLNDAKSCGANCLVTMCPFCEIQLELQQIRLENDYNESYNLPVLLYPQLLGLTLGLDPHEVGLDMNRVPAESILSFLSQ